ARDELQEDRGSERGPRHRSSAELDMGFGFSGQRWPAEQPQRDKSGLIRSLPPWFRLRPSLAGIRSGVQKPVSAPKVSACAHRKFQRNFTNASIVSFGFSSRIQLPVFDSSTTVTSDATSFICAAGSL